ncbi:hypothetical protein E4U21_005857 [Claviceps maximensis]|nr:hypothetical protein E4U21_005857 [Claviceps maximensis]
MAPSRLHQYAHPPPTSHAKPNQAPPEVKLQPTEPRERREETIEEGLSTGAGPNVNSTPVDPDPSVRTQRASLKEINGYN